MATFNATSILIDAFLEELETVQRRMNPGLSGEYADVIHAAGAMAMEIILEAERACKTTGLPAEAVCGRALMRVAWAARAAGTAAAGS